MSNFPNNNILEIVQMAWKRLLSIFCEFCIPIVIHLVYILSPCSSPDFGSSYDTLNLADVANVFVANSIPQSAASDAA
jgi:hypothetical protein